MPPVDAAQQAMLQCFICTQSHPPTDLFTHISKVHNFECGLHSDWSPHSDTVLNLLTTKFSQNQCLICFAKFDDTKKFRKHFKKEREKHKVLNVAGDEDFVKFKDLPGYQKLAELFLADGSTDSKGSTPPNLSRRSSVANTFHKGNDDMDVQMESHANPHPHPQSNGDHSCKSCGVVVGPSSLTVSVSQVSTTSSKTGVSKETQTSTSHAQTCTLHVDMQMNLGEKTDAELKDEVIRIRDYVQERRGTVSGKGKSAESGAGFDHLSGCCALLLLEHIKRQDQAETKRCPACRCEIVQKPALNRALDHQVSTYLDSLDPAARREHVEATRGAKAHYKSLKDPWGEMFPKMDIKSMTVIDEEDGVERCGACNWEVVDNECTNCKRTFGGPEGGLRFDDDDDDDGENGEDGESNSDDEGDHYIERPPRRPNVRTHRRMETDSEEQEDSEELDDSDMDDFIVNDDENDEGGNDHSSERDSESDYRPSTSRSSRRQRLSSSQHLDDDESEFGGGDEYGIMSRDYSDVEGAMDEEGDYSGGESRNAVVQIDVEDGSDIMGGISRANGHGGNARRVVVPASRRRVLDSEDEREEEQNENEFHENSPGVRLPSTKRRRQTSIQDSEEENKGEAEEMEESAMKRPRRYIADSD
ncbi:E3 ubiquitin ligase [Blyttiomyces sp. JEL0837]|nr:E3 ubiquitin ligase [Blyttiomyces sp. JEL0837]